MYVCVCVFEVLVGRRIQHKEQLIQHSRVQRHLPSHHRTSMVSEKEFVFDNGIIDHWNSLCDGCVNTTTLNKSHKYIPKNWNLINVLVMCWELEV